MSKKKPAPTLEESLANQLSDLRRNYVNEPTVIYNVGQRVQRGHIKLSIVTEVLDGGKILRLHENYVDNNYGKPLNQERDDYVLWVDVSPYISPEENKKLPIFRKNDDFTFSFQQRSIDGLLGCFYHFGIDTEPDYQRGNVWDLDDKVKLIDSIFNNVDIGKFVLINRPYKTGQKSYEILDGKQRLLALIEFFENRFEYKGVMFKDLNFTDKTHFENYSISWCDVKDEITQKQKYQYFLKLNIGGKPVDKKHIAMVQELYNSIP